MEDWLEEELYKDRSGFYPHFTIDELLEELDLEQ